MQYLMIIAVFLSSSLAASSNRDQKLKNTFLAHSVPDLVTVNCINKIILNSDTFSISTSPLESYLDTKKERKINEYSFQSSIFGEHPCYLITWELVNDSLFLKSIKSGCKNFPLEDVNLREEFGKNLVFAKWFTGAVSIPKGKAIHVNNYSPIIYESELLLTFIGGAKTDCKQFDNSLSYKSYFSETSIRDSLFYSINWNNIPDLKDTTIIVFVEWQSGQSRKPDSVKIVKKSAIEILNSEAIKAVNLLPDWDVYYYREQFLKIRYRMPIRFNEKNRKKYSRKY